MRWQTSRVTRLNFDGFCFEDSPSVSRYRLRVRVPLRRECCRYVDKNLMLKRGTAMGASSEARVSMLREYFLCRILQS